MLMHLLALVLNYPRTIEAAGEFLSRVAGLALAVGFIFKAVGGVMGSLPGAQEPAAAQQFLPGLPTWWIPESTVGVVAWAFVLALGLGALFGGRHLRHQMEAYR